MEISFPSVGSYSLLCVLILAAFPSFLMIDRPNINSIAAASSGSKTTNDRVQEDFFPERKGSQPASDNDSNNSHRGFELNDTALASLPKNRIRNRHGLRSPSTVGKNYVLDTNVLLHDPGSIYQFADNHVCIPFEVLCELDRFKNEQSERGANARRVHRDLARMFSSQPKSAIRGIPTPAGGTIRLVICRPEDRRIRRVTQRMRDLLPDIEAADHRILLCVAAVRQVNHCPVALVTKDLNLQLKAHALGLACDDYLNDKVIGGESMEPSPRTLEVESAEMQRFASRGSLDIEASRAEGVSVNDHLLLSAGGKRTMPARFTPDQKLSRLRIPEVIRVNKGTPIRPLNLGQRCFLDALLNPEISLVTCFGQAGTGKTLLAVAAALHSTLDGQYNGVTVSRPVVPLGDTLGYLPGSLDEKLDPWLKPIFDALEFVLAPREGQANRKPRKNSSSESRSAPGVTAQKPYQGFIDSGMIEIEALCYIRGRSIPKRYFILDEAQQLTPLEAKTIVTRMAEGSKLVMVGDPEQIDNPYVDQLSNGLVHTRDRLRSEPCAAHVTLERGERSALADAAARLM